MIGFLVWLQGKKTNLLSSVGIGLALFLYLSGATDVEIAGFMAIISGGLSTLHAQGERNKNGGA